MNRGYSELNTSIFVVFFLVMTAAAGYLYFSGSKIDPVTATSSIEVVDNSTGIIFAHPFYGYTLTLPYNWKDKYRVEEGVGRTDFLYDDHINPTELLFSLWHFDLSSPTASSGLIGGARFLGQDKNFSYYLLQPVRLSLAVSADDGRMRNEIGVIGDSFSSPSSGLETLVAQTFSHPVSSASSSQLNFISFETIATEEKATTTEYYLWLVCQRFDWPLGHLQAGSVIDGPVKIVFAKSDQAVISYRSSLVGNKNSSGFIFPASVRDSAITRVGTNEHKALLQKMTNDLNDRIISYFGAEPIVTRAGVVEDVSENNGVVGLRVHLADVAVRVMASSGLQYLIKTSERAVTSLVVSSDTIPLFNYDGSGTPVVISPNDLPSLFSRTATSSFRQKPYWFDIQADRLVKIYPFNN